MVLLIFLEWKLFFYFVRQFSIYNDDEYSHLEQLHCDYLFKLTDELKARKGRMVNGF